MILKTENLSFSYPCSKILDSVNLEVQAGRCLAILGINGVGKSTLLKCIGGLLKPEEGRVLLDGKPVRDITVKERSKLIGYVPQSFTFGDGTVFDTVLAGRRPYIRWNATENDMDITASILERLQLSDIALKNVNHLSYGQMQLIAVGRALAQQPKVLLFDEPTSSLDIKNQMDVLTLIKSIARQEGIAVIVTLHDINLALKFADSFAMMKDSCIRAFGGVEIITEASIMDVYGLAVDIVQSNGHKIVIPK